MEAKHLQPNSKKRISLKSKVLMIILSLTLIICLAFSGSPTLTWMVTGQKKDTITFNKVSLSITITDAANRQIVPGLTYTLSAAPQATVAANSVPCYLFVHVVESVDQFDDFSYASGWTQVGSTGYYYRTVATSTSAQSFAVFASNKVKAKDSLTHSSGTLAASKITINYCAIQQANLTATTAQAQIKSVI